VPWAKVLFVLLLSRVPAIHIDIDFYGKLELHSRTLSLSIAPVSANEGLTSASPSKTLTATSRPR
jgi:hypothetical protein